MREDMFKVLVERPRLVNSNPYSRDGRKYRNKEENGTRLGIREGYVYTKSLNENLAPLKRFLEKQVNRPWDKVYAEICAQIDTRSTVKQHILLHLEDFVAIDTRWQENGRAEKWGGRCSGEVVMSDGLRPVAQSRYRLFVHPRTGILLRNRHVKKYSRAVWQSTQQAAQQLAQENTRQIDDHTRLLRVQDIWYCVTWQDFPPARPVITGMPGKGIRQQYDVFWDVLKKTWVSGRDGARQYASSKRQLSSKELEQYQLQAKTQGAPQNKK